MRTVAQSRLAGQTAGFAAANGAATLLAAGATILLTRNLSTEQFGAYSFSVSLLFFVALFFELGLVLPAARLAATTTGRLQKDIIGAALLLNLIAAALFSLTIFVLSLYIDTWFNVRAGHPLRVAAVAAAAFPLVNVLYRLAQGSDRLHIASVSTVGAQLVLIALLAVVARESSFTATTAVVVRAVGVFVATAAGVIWLRPSFGSARLRAAEILHEARTWGMSVSIGRLLSTGTYNMDVLMLGIWTNARWVGLYGLANAIATASGLPVFSLSSALFPRMATATRIARRWFVVSLVVGIVCAAAAWLLAEPAIRFAFSPRYVAAASLVLPLALAWAVRGVTGIFNTFLSAHGNGDALRKSAFVLTASNVVLNFALIPPFGAAGAAWASLLALVANLVAHVSFYRRSSESSLPSAMADGKNVNYHG